MADKPRIQQIAALTAALLLTAVMASCGGQEKEFQLPDRATWQIAPAFDLEKVGGGRVNLASLNGKVRVVDFWTTWCVQCIEEIPMYKEFHSTYNPDDFQIIGISMDEKSDTLEDLAPLLEKHEVPYTTLLGTEKIEEAYGVVGYPATFIIDREGKIVKSFTGAKPKRVMKQHIEALLNVPAANGTEPGQ